MVDPYRLLSREFLLVALKDYRRGGPETRTALRQWLSEDEAMLAISAELMGLPLGELKAKLASQMDKIDQQHL